MPVLTVDRDRLRTDHADALDELAAPVEEQVAESLRRVLRQAFDGVHPALIAAGSDAPLPPLDLSALDSIPTAWADEVDRFIGPILVDTYELSAEQAVARFVGAVDFDRPGFAVRLEESARGYMADARNRLVGIGDTSWAIARGELERGIVDGDDLPAMTARVQHVLDVNETRARTIARTETIGVSNAATIAGARAFGAGAPTQKEWLAAKDSRTRDTHWLADGQRVGLDDAFTVGGSRLDFPGDPGGPAREVVNCRCTILLVDDRPLDGEEEPGPPAPAGVDEEEKKRRRSEAAKKAAETRRRNREAKQRQQAQDAFPEAGFDHARHVEDWLQTRWPTAKTPTGSSIDRVWHLRGLPTVDANRIGRVMDDLLRRYPNTGETLVAFGESAPVTSHARRLLGDRGRRVPRFGRANADAWPLVPWIRLGPIFREPGALLRQKLVSWSTGWSAPGALNDAVGSVVRHEFGHHVLFHARRVVQRGGRSNIDLDLGSLVKMRARDAGFRSPKQYVTQELSEYASTNVDELVAEAFAEVEGRGPAARPLARAIYDLVVRVAEEGAIPGPASV